MEKLTFGPLHIVFGNAPDKGGNRLQTLMNTAVMLILRLKSCGAQYGGGRTSMDADWLRDELSIVASVGVPIAPL